MRAVAPPRFQKYVTANIADCSNWSIPKFFNMRKYEQLILLFGNVEQLSSAPGERTNAQFKPHAAFTNRHPGSITQVTVGGCCIPVLSLQTLVRLS